MIDHELPDDPASDDDSEDPVIEAEIEIDDEGSEDSGLDWLRANSEEFGRVAALYCHFVPAVGAVSRTSDDDGRTVSLADLDTALVDQRADLVYEAGEYLTHYLRYRNFQLRQSITQARAAVQADAPSRTPHNEAE